MAVVGSAEFELRAKRDQLAADLRRGEQEVKASLDRSERQATRQLTKLQRASRLNLARQGADVFTSAAGGASPSMIAFQQGPQVLDALATSGIRASGALVGVGAALSGVAAGVLLVAAAWQKGESDALAFERAATGVGRTAGLTGTQLEALTIAAAEQGEVSVKAAREMATAFLSTGQIGGEAISSLIELARDYSSFMGVDAADATKQLAKAMLDPAKAAHDWTAQFGLLDQAQIKDIENMVEQGNLMGAQKILYQELDRAVEGHAGKLGTIESAWDAIGRSISDAVDAVGRYFYTTEDERFNQIVAQRGAIERERRLTGGRDRDPRAGRRYEELGREGSAILAARARRKAAADAAAKRQADELAAQNAPQPPRPPRIGGGPRRSPSLPANSEQTLRDLAARREALTIEGQVAVLKAQGRDAEAAAAQRRLDVLNLTRTYEAAGFEQAKELAEAQVAAMADAETRQRAIVNGQQAASRWLELAIDGQRQSADLALERARYEAQIAGLRGDPRSIEQAERDLYIQERINDLLRDKVGLITAADLAAATAQATSEADVLGSADREGRLRDEFRRSFVDGMRAAIDGDVGGLFESLADRFSDRMLENLADDLFDLLQNAGKGGGGGFLGSIFGGLKSLIPGFSSGVSNFGGGLAYVHKDEVLMNLSKGTSVIPAHAVRAMGAMAGGMGGARSAPALARVIVETNDDRFNAYVDNRVAPQASAAFTGARQTVPSDMARTSKYTLSGRR